MTSLAGLHLFELKALVKNFKIKKSAYIEDLTSKQILCLVGESNELLFRCSYKGEEPPRVNVKIVSWFKNSNKNIQDVCFDPSGAMLLVLCYDNTLHTIPVLWILYRTAAIDDFHLAGEKITSFIVPFAGPHECPNSKTCPNNGDDTTSESSSGSGLMLNNDQNGFPSANQIDELYNKFFMSDTLESTFENIDIGAVSNSEPSNARDNIFERSVTAKSSMDNESFQPLPCPYPTSCVWWQTFDSKQCAIIGYSDGSICIVGLQPNCPLIASTLIQRGAVMKMFICRDTIMKNVTLMINSSMKEQWKLLLEQNSIGYTYPGDINSNSAAQPTKSSPDDLSSSNSKVSSSAAALTSKTTEDDWQIVIPLNDNEKQDENNAQQPSTSTDSYDQLQGSSNENKDSFVDNSFLPTSGIRARLASLRDLGAKKIGALKLKLVENRMRLNEKEKIKDQMSAFAIMDVPAIAPEILTTPSGPYFIVQCIKDTHLLSALHSYSDTLSVHSMNISLIPMYIYKIPKDCNYVLVTPSFMYTIQHFLNTNELNVGGGGGGGDEPLSIEQNMSNSFECSSSVDSTDITNNNAVGVVSCNTTSLHIGEDADFHESSLMTLFQLTDEYVIDVHRVSWPDIEATNEFDRQTISTTNNNNNNGNNKSLNASNNKSSTQNYAENRKMYERNNDATDDIDDRRLMQCEFPKIEIDKCMVVTNKNLYVIEIKEPPNVTFLNMVKQNQWNVCEEFCKVFNLNYAHCLEYAGDVFLRQKKTTQALIAYNAARIPPVKAALKLAMHGENGALMHLCAKALKIVYILKSKYPISSHVKYLKNTEEYRNSVKGNKNQTYTDMELLTGVPCSDFSYQKDEAGNDLQLSNSSQFHLSNLLLLTLAERTIREKQFMPLWNFLVVNKRYHTKMTSIVLCQSGLYYSAVLLALVRGAHLDAFCGLVSSSNQDFGWYSELNTILTNISDKMFMECIMYLHTISLDYFCVIQSKIDKIDLKVLEKLMDQLSPFDPVYRPIVSQLTSNKKDNETNESDKEFLDFCKFFIETFLIIVMKVYMYKTPTDNYMNALNSIYVSHEENQFAIKVENCSPISAGFSHCACIVDGSVYMWGSNGINCALVINAPQDASTDGYNSPKRLQFDTNMGLEVHAVKCGRTHTLILTNNGLYSMGANNLGQLGIGKFTAQALQPMLVREFDGKNISQIEIGQYHNAVVADGCLYTWGWGLHGQLGHGSVEDVYRPKIVSFLRDKKIKQISLGHAHTLVLCYKNKNNLHDTILYVFGSNHFGQLGMGRNVEETMSNRDHMYNNTLSKVLSPIELVISKNIRLIHTKFFTNFIVTEDNDLLTWGASPQALRLQTQARKRARANQKHEDFTKCEQQTNVTNQKQTSSNDTKNILPTTQQSVDDISIVQHTSIKRIDGGVDKNSLSSSGKSKSMSDLNAIDSKHDNKETKSDENSSQSEQQQQQSKCSSFEDECNEHMQPSVVDTSEVLGNILQVSSGLYHYGLVTDKQDLYTWGKNLEKQLGRDSSKMECITPTHLDTIDNVIHVECGADFTLVMSADHIVKAFGSNSYGQCGRDINSDKNSTTGKLIRLRISKRLVRLPDDSQCFETPLNVNLPRPKIRMDFDPVRYLKSLPKFKRRYIIKCRLIESMKPSHTSTIESNLANIIIDQDYISTGLDNLHVNEFNRNCLIETNPSSFSDDDISAADEMHNNLLTNNTLISPINITTLNESLLFNINENDEDAYNNEFIHYCLFIFHGIYDPTKILEFATKKEFKIRVMMLNYRVTEAFSLCISDTKSAQQAIAIFEYFTNDSSVVPIHREDLKFLIYELFMHFINHKFCINDVEEYLLNDLDTYLLALAYVLYFSNNNTDLERQVTAKYSHLFEGDLDYPNTLVNTDRIFKTVSVAFKTHICQRLLDWDNNTFN